MRSRTSFPRSPGQRIRRGVFRSIVDLQAAIHAYLAEHDANPKPFVWTKSATPSPPNLTAFLYHLNAPKH